MSRKLLIYSHILQLKKIISVIEEPHAKEECAQKFSQEPVAACLSVSTHSLHSSNLDIEVTLNRALKTDER